MRLLPTYYFIIVDPLNRAFVPYLIIDWVAQYAANGDLNHWLHGTKVESRNPVTSIWLTGWVLGPVTTRWSEG